MALLIIPIIFMLLFKSTRGIAWFLIASFLFMLVGVEAGVIGVIALGVLAICVAAVFFTKFSTSENSKSDDKHSLQPETPYPSKNDYKKWAEHVNKKNPEQLDGAERMDLIDKSPEVSPHIFQTTTGIYIVAGPRGGSKAFKTLSGAESYRDRIHRSAPGKAS